VNPPVHAWACRKAFTWGALVQSEPDFEFLKRAFPKLLMNFTWWLNRKDPDGEDLFSGGFMGLDNIGVFDRSASLPGGARLEQSDATAWMVLFCNEMLAIALTLARHDPSYGEMASTFVQHFAQISEALNGPSGLWDEEAGFYHDEVRSGDHGIPLKVRSLVGLLPLVGTVMLQGEPGLDGARRRLLELRDRFPWLGSQIVGPVERPGPDGRLLPTWLLSLVPRDRAERLLSNLFYAQDPEWKELIQFNEYFHGDTGRGCGASHQTGWTGLVAALAYLRAQVSGAGA